MENDIERLNGRITELEVRLKQIDGKFAIGGNGELQITAPVTVVDQDGNLIVEIRSIPNDRSIKIFSEQGRPVAAIGADGTHAGYLAIRNTKGVLVGYLTSEITGGKFLVNDNEQKAGVVLYVDDIDGGGINILDRSGDLSVVLPPE